MYVALNVKVFARMQVLMRVSKGRNNLAISMIRILLSSLGHAFSSSSSDT